MSNETGKAPSFQFYPADWRNDTGLRSCSITARGVWVEMMCLMHHAEPYGHLVLNGHPMTVLQISRAISEKKSLVSKSLTELETNGVFSRTQNGSIYSRRMVRDEALRRIRREVGALGGNPKLKVLVNQTPNHRVNIPDKIPDNQSPTPSSSSSSDVQVLEPSALVRPEPGRPPDKIPFAELREAYNKRRGALPEAKTLTEFRKKKLRARWVEKPDLAYWDRVFEKAGRSQVMVKWASFGWLIGNAENHVKTAEGNYDNDRENKTAPRAPSPPAERRPAEPPPPDMSQDDLDEMHRDKVKALGPSICKDAVCRACRKPEYVEAESKEHDVLVDELPV